MSYTISLVNQSPITIQNGATDNTTSLTLVGKNYPNYGQLLQQDLVNMLQSWAGATQPVSAVTGQLWFNTSTNSLSIYTGTGFKKVNSSTVSTTQPSISVTQGDFWYKSDDQQFYIYTGATWLLIGPSYTSSQQQTNAIALSIQDNTAATHTVLAFYVGNFLTGIISKDPTFTPATSITGFSTINPGYNINTTIFTGAVPLSGQLVTNAQPYVTSLGTLTGLTVSTPIVGSVLYNANTVTYASQPNITSVGTLTSLTSSGTITANAFSGPLNGTVGATSPTVGTFTTATVARVVEAVVTLGSVGNSATIDWSVGDVQTLTLTSNCSLSFSNPPSSGKSQSLTLVVSQDSTGGRLLSYPASVRWSYAQAPVLTTNPTYRDVISFITYDGGSTYLGAYSMANVAP
jgi:hypothetical protein